MPVHSAPIPSPTSARSAYSLIELLATLGILAVVAGTLGPATIKAQTRTRTAICLSHLRQWGAATHLHLADNSDKLPSDGAPNGISVRDAWYVDLPKALGIPPYPEAGAWRTNSSLRPSGTLWDCPSNPRRSNGRILFHYALNRLVNGSGESARTRIASQIPEPATLVWMFDNGGLAAVAAEGNSHTNLHQDGAHFLFLDGHVTRLPTHAYRDKSTLRPLQNPTQLRWNH